jgi:hypothetical protein
MDMPSSLMMYPMPNPSCATGPKPNNLNAGLPQFDVERMLVFNTDHPGSVNIAGSVRLADGGDRGGEMKIGPDSSEDDSERAKESVSLISR